MRSLIPVVLVLAVTAGYVLLHPPENLAEGRGSLAAVPAAFGAWNGSDLSFEDAVIEELKPGDLLVRRYTRGREVVWLCLVSHRGKRYGAHDPKVCYESQGWLIEREEFATVDDGTESGLRVHRFLAERPGRERLVYYWWATRGLATPDREAFQNRLALEGVVDDRAWGTFVRVETPIEGGDRIPAERRLREFSSAVARGLPDVFAAAAPAGTR